MIDIIVSMGNNLDDLKKTLYSLGYDSKFNVIISVCEENKKYCNLDDLKALLPEATLNLCDCAQSDDLQKFLCGLNSNHARGNYVTFLKAGDIICNNYIFNTIEELFDKNPSINMIQGGATGEKEIITYNGKNIKLQGKIFKRFWLDRFNIVRSFVNDIEFALYFSCMCDAVSGLRLEIPVNLVRIASGIEGWGEAYVHFFSNVFPKNNYYNKELVDKYICQALCDFYFIYLSALNLDYLEEEVSKILKEIQLFYSFFKNQELENLETLLMVYNENVLIHYSSYDDPSIVKIPCLSIVSFLDELESISQ